MTQRGADQYPFRFPEGMRDRIKTAAKANRRSMNAEIIARLEQTFNENHLASAPLQVISIEDAMRLMEARWAREHAEQDKRVCFDLPEPVKPAPQPSQSEAAA